MNDPTEDIRREMIATGQPAAELAADTEQKWDTTELQRDYNVICFAAPLVVVKRKADGVHGTLMFSGHPRQYFGFKAT
jgi:hypothetical protein